MRAWKASATMWNRSIIYINFSQYFTTKVKCDVLNGTFIAKCQYKDHLWSVYYLTPALHLRVTYTPHVLLSVSNFDLSAHTRDCFAIKMPTSAATASTDKTFFTHQCHRGAGTAITSAYSTSPVPVFHKRFYSQSCHFSFNISLCEFVMETGSWLKVVPFKALDVCYGNVKITPQHPSPSPSPSCL